MSNKHIIVLGFHRSGTSCLTDVIREAGWYVGNAEDAPKTDPKYGHCERNDVRDLNDRILKHAGGDWKNPPTSLVGNYNIEIGRLLAKLPPPAVIKDPRLCLTWPVWMARYDFKIVGIIRPMENSVDSLRERKGLPYEKLIHLYYRYNAGLWDAVKKHGGCIINHADLMRCKLSKLSEYLGVDLAPAAKEVVNPELTHHPIGGDNARRNDILSLLPVQNGQ